MDNHHERSIREGNAQHQPDTCNVLISTTGRLYHPKWPDLKGLTLYKGVLVRRARYPEGLDLGGKRIVALGSGPSGVQIVPSVLNSVGHRDIFYHWIRSPICVVPIVGLI
ncbi:uncharacterized protein EV420DRAFT_1563472, partial [Desarmillaria tabescens]